MFKRKIYAKMLEWKRRSKGSTALLIEGARRIGKSTIALEFAKNEYESYILIDFSRAGKDLKSLFDDLSSTDYLFMQLQLLFNTKLVERKSLIIFDEVQFCPKARQAIKLLVEDGKYDYIETGSLISIRKNVENILIPSEEEKLSMYPMDFEEFLWATGDTASNDILRECFLNGTSLGEAANRKMLLKFRLYMLVGGMPQAVAKYIESNNLEEVDMVKRNIITLYLDDFYKLDGRGFTSDLYKNIPSELSRHTSSYKISSVLKNERPSTVQDEIRELIESKTVLASYNSTDPSASLALTKDINKFKLYLSDTGLFVTLMFMDKPFTKNEIYKKLLSNKSEVNLGMLYENAVATSLRSLGYDLYFNTSYDEDYKKSYELDFLISSGNKIYPIEVKSSGYKAHKSLDVFIDKYRSRIGKSFVIYTKDYLKEGDIEYLPVYYTQFLDEI
ncbi:ATP-binding protein [Fenollaria massiliensis]|uniref:AAA family ATPase n=1 Tax=Fenollaria massiliensis TaxID=938288 RepID=A0A9E7DJK6_9FIRM|nr:AAA family ATPase [Fenollaria massiliensis]UQK59091.1 AAA family ATPase [Fenollaria massiliensis]